MGPSGPALTLSLTHSSVAPPSLPPPFLSDPWADWKGPGVRTFILVSIGLYVYVQLLPSRESMKRPHTPSAARPSFDTVAKQGEDDPRPYMIRVFDYWIPGFEERQKAKMEEAYKEVDEARQANVFKTAVPSKIVRRADYLCVLESSLWRLSAHANPADSDPLTLPLSVSSSFFSSWLLSEPYHKEAAGPGQVADLKDVKVRTAIDDELEYVLNHSAPPRDPPRRAKGFES